MRVCPATSDDLATMTELAARLQHRPEHHVTYLGLDAQSIAEELVDEGGIDVGEERRKGSPWPAVSAVAFDGDVLIGWLVGSVDESLGRVWWFGPFVDDEPRPSDGDRRDGSASAADRWTVVADRLDEVARAGLPDGVTQEEWAFDSRHAVGPDWATRRGGTIETGSAVLGRTADLPAPTHTIRAITDIDTDAVARLHDSLFPGTHTPGATLVAGAPEDRVVLVAPDDSGAVVGYVAVELQPDGGGYVDFVGVSPDARGRGWGADLIRGGVAALRSMGCERVDLTVRADNASARALYARLGFEEERVIVPVRRGFALG